MAEGVGDEGGGEELGVFDEVEGGDEGVLLLNEEKGAEVKALDLGAALHVFGGDSSDEGVDEDLGIDGVVLAGVAGEVGVLVGEELEREGIGEDLGFEVEADLFGGEGALSGVRVGAAEAGAVELGVEADEHEELGGVGGDVGAAEGLLPGEGDGDGGQGEVVALIGEGVPVELVADEGALGFGHGDVADADAILEGVGLAVGAATGIGVEELIVAEEGLAVGGDAGVGFEGGDEVVESGLEGGEGVFGAKAAAAPVGGDVEAGEADALAGGNGAGAAGFGDDLLEEVGAIGDDAVDVEVDEPAHGCGVVGGPGDDADALLVQGFDGDAAVEDAMVDG